MRKELTIKEVIREGIEKYDLYGRSFTYGLALYKMIRNKWITERNDRFGIEEMLISFIGEDLYEMMEDRGLDTTMIAMVEMIRIEDLDELAERLIEEE